MPIGTYMEPPSEPEHPTEPITTIHLETGVDRLIKIIAREKKVELGAAAKELGVPADVVQEWANFLQEDHLISIEYTLSRVYLLERQMTKTEINEKHAEYDLKKTAFIRKVNVALQELESEAEAVETLKQEYRKVEEYLGNNLEEIKDDVELLNHFEDLKSTVDNDIKRQREEYERSINNVHNRIETEEHRYSQILETIKNEIGRVQTEHSEVAGIRQEEETLLKRVNDLKSVMKSLGERLAIATQGTKQHEMQLQKMRQLAEELQTQISKQREHDIEPLMKISSDQEQRILRIQNEIIRKVKDRFEKLQYYEGKSEEPIKHLKQFFERRTSADKTFEEFNKTEFEMKKELTDLILKAKAFDLAVNQNCMNEHIKELAGKFEEYNSKKGAIAAQIRKLKEFLKVT